MPKDMNSAVSAQREAVEAIALPLSRGSVAIQAGAAYDDLVQEGLIQVWQNLGKGVEPLHYVEYRMRDYVRWLGLQIGIGRGGNVPYETMLPLDDYRAMSKHSYDADVDPLADLDKVNVQGEA